MRTARPRICLAAFCLAATLALWAGPTALVEARQLGHKAVVDRVQKVAVQMQSR